MIDCRKVFMLSCIRNQILNAITVFVAGSISMSEKKRSKWTLRGIAERIKSKRKRRLARKLMVYGVVLTMIEDLQTVETGNVEATVTGTGMLEVSVTHRGTMTEREIQNVLTLYT